MKVIFVSLFGTNYFAWQSNSIQPNPNSSPQKGAVLQDHFNNYDHALTAYNKAYTLVLTTTTAAEAGTGREEEEMRRTTRTTITDPPEDPNSILSQLQHLIGK